MEKLLITGGAGYFGSYCSHQFAKNGYDVTVIDKKDFPRVNNLGIKYKKADLSLGMVDIKEKYDAVIHLAAIRFPQYNCLYPYTENISSTINILNNCIQKKIRKFIFASTCQVYKPSQDAYYDENSSVLLPDFNDYGSSKLFSEDYINCMSATNVFRHIILRFSNLFGIHENIGSIPINCENIGLQIYNYIKGETQNITIFENSSKMQEKDYVSIQDAFNALEKSLHSTFIGSVNISSNTQISDKKILEMVRQIRSQDFSKINICSTSFNSYVADNKKAKDVLGWQPKVSLEQSLEEFSHISF